MARLAAKWPLASIIASSSAATFASDSATSVVTKPVIVAATSFPFAPQSAVAVVRSIIAAAQVIATASVTFEVQAAVFVGQEAATTTSSAVVASWGLPSVTAALEVASSA